MTYNRWYAKNQTKPNQTIEVSIYETVEWKI